MAELNPYASPTNPEESEPFDLQRDIVLQYVHDAALQSSAALSTPGNSVIRALSAIGLIAVGFFGGRWLSNFAYALPIDDDTMAEVLSVGILVLCVVGTTSLQFLLINRLIAAREIRRLRKHRVVGVLGDWQLAVDKEYVTIQTSGGLQSWPLATCRYEVNDLKTPILWLESDLPIALPYTAGDKDFQSRRADAVLRDRVGNVQA
jgi:hypothetical protein